MPRHHNFSAGPALLPLSVIQELQEALPNFKDSNIGLMELSHRSSTFEAVIQNARDRFRRLLNIPADYHVLFLQGGASLQFYMSALNLLQPDEKASYIMTGTWSIKALKEARRCSQSVACWEPNDGVYNRVPQPHEIQIDGDSVYTHYTTNNTIFGTQFHHMPLPEGRLVADMSSDICSRPIDVSRFEMIYAGAQKNLGPSGVTAIILSPWAAERSRHMNSLRSGGLPSMLNYDLMITKESMFNTPNTFGIFALERMLAWMEGLGGLETIAQINQEKATLLYDQLSGFWTPHAQEDSRSLMNVTWRSPSAELDSKFIEQAKKNGLQALKGHRSVGGIRASIYNSCSRQSVEALVDFMKHFVERHG